MKALGLILFSILVCLNFAFGQTTLTVDANGVLNSTKIITQTANGQSFFTGHQLGSGYSYPTGIFRAITDNPNGLSNYFFDGLAGSTTNFSVRADGQGYFAGNVGIGTGNFQAKFNVYQSIGLGSNPLNSSLLSTISGLSGTGNVFQNNIWLVRNAAGSDWYTTRLHDGISIDGSFLSPEQNTQTWWERDPSHNIQSWGNSNNTYLTINNSNIGIGTLNPASKLHTQVTNNGLNIIGGFQNLDPTQTGGNAVGIGFLNEAQGSWWKAAIVHERTGPYGTGSLKFLVNNSIDNSTVSLNDVKMTIISSGNVGIGTANPQNKLDVNGTIHSKQVNVDMNNWPDYVFTSNYTQPTLGEVKTYIDQNHHLPEIPSEQEVIKNGVNLGEMNKLLVKKVEELTLYLIEKDKKEKEQAEINKKQQAQIDELNKKLEILMSKN